MKATEILEWIVRESIEGEDLLLIDVPSVDDEDVPQDDEWWYNMIGESPEEMVDAGRYLVLYPNDARDFICTSTKEYVPDATILFNDGETIVYLYKVEE
jgi:hypothetical protein